MVADGKTLVFTDVIASQERLLAFAANTAHAENQALYLFHTLFSGSAMIWWNSEHTVPRRRQLRDGGMPVVLDVLRGRFKQDCDIATTEFTQGEIYLKDLTNVYKSQSTLLSDRGFAQKEKAVDQLQKKHQPEPRSQSHIALGQYGLKPLDAGDY